MKGPPSVRHLSISWTVRGGAGWRGEWGGGGRREVTQCVEYLSGCRNSSLVVCCLMQCRRFDTLPGRIFLVEKIFPLELTWVLTPVPRTLSDESINRGLVCAHMHSIARTDSKDREIHVLDGCIPATKTHPACTTHEDGMGLPQWLD